MERNGRQAAGEKNETERMKEIGRLRAVALECLAVVLLVAGMGRILAPTLSVARAARSLAVGQFPSSHLRPSAGQQ